MRYIGNIFSTPDKSHIIFILLIVIAIGYITSLISGFALWICIVCLYIILLTNGIIGTIYEIYSYNKIVKKKKIDNFDEYSFVMGVKKHKDVRISEEERFLLDKMIQDFKLSSQRPKSPTMPT